VRAAFDQANWGRVTDFTDAIVLTESDLSEPEGSVKSTYRRFALSRRLGRVDRITIVKAGLTDSQLRLLLLEFDALSSPITVLADVIGGEEALLAPGDFWIVRSAAMRSRTALIKRAIDVCASLFALIVFSPLMAAVAVAIRIETPGPALFRQLRHGRNGRPFTVLKFRTMRSDVASADGSVQAVRGDARVTRVGAFLRKTSIDELPQLLNVFTGSMSLVGPRPHPLALDQRFVPLIDRYSARQRVVPGITGWAQINGSRGETKSVEQMRRRVELDLEYIRDHSIAFDLLILFRTVTSLFTHRDTAY
jgi:exopolysaccharide biosynthesis polyprenyl glycosylphosphotransferase